MVESNETLTLYCAALRRVVAELLRAIPYAQLGLPAGLQLLVGAIETARDLLDDPTGAVEQQQGEIQAALGAHAYTLADEVSWQLRGYGLHPEVSRPTRRDLEETLDDIAVLTAASLALAQEA